MYLPVTVYVYLSVLSVSLNVFLCSCFFVSVPVCLSVCVHVCLFVCLYVCLILESYHDVSISVFPLTPGGSHLSEGALADERVDFVAVEPLLPVLHNVVVVVVVVTIVVNFPLFFGARVLGRNLLRTSLLFSVVHLQGVGKQKGVGLQRGKQ